MAQPNKVQAYRSMKRLFKSYVRGCKRRNVFWGLTIEQFHELTNQPCEYCALPPVQVSRAYTYNGIDRMNPKQGYVPENCVTACKGCNWIKGDRLSFEEMKIVGEALSTFRKKKR